MRIVIAEAGMEYGIASDTPIRTPEDAANQGKPFAYEVTEQFAVLILNSKNGMIASEIITSGILDASLMHPREVFRAAITRGGAAIVLIHNHPSGDPTPSAEDVRITRQLVAAGKILDIKVLDHIIIAPSGNGAIKHLSMREAGLITI